MFSKIKNFSEEMTKSLNDLNESLNQPQQNQQPPAKPDPLTQLKKGSKILSANTPEMHEVTQPTDEDQSTSKPSSPAPAPAPTEESQPAVVDPMTNLPPQIKAKLKKFAKYEEKYPILLEAYKTEKHKGELVSIFEKVLRENTPVNSISEAGTLVDYLNGLNEKTKLLNSEIRKLTKENSVLTFKTAKLEEEKKHHDENEKAKGEKEDGGDMAKAKIEELEKEIMQLKESIGTHALENEELHEENEKLKADTESSKVEVDTLKQENEKLKTDIESNKQEIETLKQEKEKLETEVSGNKEKWEVEINDKTTKLDASLAEINTLEIEIAKTKEKLEVALSEIEQLKSRSINEAGDVDNTKFEKAVQTTEEQAPEVEEPQAQPSIEEKDQTSAEEKVPELAEETLKTEETSGQFTQEIDSLKNQILDLETKLTQKEQENNELSEKLQTLREQLNDKNDEIEDLRDLVRDIGNELVVSKDEIKDLKTKQAEQEATASKIDEAEVQKYLDTIESLKSNIASWEEKFNTKSKKLDGFQDKVSQLQNELDTKDSTSKKAEDSLRKEIQATKSTLNSTEAKLAETKREVENLLQEKSGLEKRITELSKFKSNDSSLKLEISALQESISQKDKTIAESRKKVDEVMKENKSLQVMVAKLQSSSNELQNNSMGLLKEKSELLTRQELLVENTKSLNTQLNKLQSEKQQVVNELDRTKAKLDLLMAEKSNSSNDFLIYKKQHEELMMKTKEYTLRIEGLEDEVNEARNLLQERNREGASIRRLLVDAEEMLRNKEVETKNEINRLNEERMELERLHNMTMNRKQREIDELKLSINDYKTKIKSLENKIEESKKASVLQTSGFETNKMDRELNSTIDTLRSALQQASKKSQEYENLNNILKKLNEENNMKFERLSKNYKLLTQQYRNMKERSKLESEEALALQQKLNQQQQQAGGNKQSELNIDYLKNVLLGFFEHKDQRQQLLPVVKTIFHLTPEDEQKFLLALK